MRLVQPTDFEILDALADGKRNNASTLAVQLDKQRAYINTRLPALVDYGPLTKIGLYEITDRGIAALALREDYETTDGFDARLDAHPATNPRSTSGSVVPAPVHPTGHRR